MSESGSRREAEPFDNPATLEAEIAVQGSRLLKLLATDEAGEARRCDQSESH